MSGLVVKTIHGFVPQSIALVDDIGRMSMEWYRYFLELYQYSGLSGDMFSLWGELSVGGAQVTPGAADTPTLGVLAGNNQTYGFSASAENKAHAVLVLPGDYVDGSDLWPFIRWAPDGTNTGSCSWELLYAPALEGAVVPAETTVTLSDVGDGVSYGHQYIEAAAAIDGTTFKSGSVIMMTVKRDGAAVGDTLTDIAWLMSAGFHYNVGVSGKKGRWQ